ncbi:MAG TPA: NADH-quinone oxidoreductase subunit J [Gammaproteobacteria bacterium]|nr:NADH-quinone oxidoreductase subunit J [Gammaproteobacteria bacterium]
MIFHELMFYLLAGILLVAGLRVITVKNPVHAALHLVLAFVASAGLWIMLQAEFLGLVLVLVYVGAVMVLFLFVVMMIDISLATIREGFTKHAPLGAVIAAVVAAEIGYVMWSKASGVSLGANPVNHPAGYSNTQALGQVLYTHYVYPFEIASAILLVGIISAIALTMRRRAGTRHQNIDEQVRVRRQDRVRLVSMAAEKREPAAEASEPEAVE